jgi:hypothetical protein
MKGLMGVILLALLAGVVMALLRKLKGGEGDKIPTQWPVYAKRVLSQPEQVLYQRLVRAYPNYVVLSQVALPALIGVKKGENFQAWYNRFGRLYCDFVLCEKDFRVAAVIELDDRSHDAPRRQDADARKAAALQAAGIPLHRVNVNPLPNEEDLLQLLPGPKRLTGG